METVSVVLSSIMNTIIVYFMAINFRWEFVWKGLGAAGTAWRAVCCGVV